MTLLYLCSDQMGSGDPDLGRLLMKRFLAQLAASDTPVDMIGCVNDGVKLTTEGSGVIDSLQHLADKGAQITTCATCLEHLELTDKLLIGGLGTMNQSIHAMAMADKIIRP